MLQPDCLNESCDTMAQGILFIVNSTEAVSVPPPSCLCKRENKNTSAKKRSIEMYLIYNLL